ncbi:hypothetical protein ANCDUO_03333 [Ancylostoma duodenale]|uniref:Uncharacterized protein n=1 Tax=Ancylostoma duodenale TaxID=51022 RepID=A0A0C2GXT5_9BILA|nr:hypothetical protein ANCDUO_03333 [Ancylostoma duodenale]
MDTSFRRPWQAKARSKVGRDRIPCQARTYSWTASATPFYLIPTLIAKGGDRPVRVPNPIRLPSAIHDPAPIGVQSPIDVSYESAYNEENFITIQ